MAHESMVCPFFYGLYWMYPVISHKGRIFSGKAILYSGGDLAKDGKEAQEGFSTQFVCVKEIEP